MYTFVDYFRLCVVNEVVSKVERGRKYINNG